MPPLRLQPLLRALRELPPRPESIHDRLLPAFEAKRLDLRAIQAKPAMRHRALLRFRRSRSACDAVEWLACEKCNTQHTVLHHAQVSTSPVSYSSRLATVGDRDSTCFNSSTHTNADSRRGLLPCSDGRACDWRVGILVGFRLRSDQQDNRCGDEQKESETHKPQLQR
jgi:hypothetical protein